MSKIVSIILEGNKTKKQKYLGVTFDQLLTFQSEVKSIKREMTCGIKTINKKTADNPKQITINECSSHKPFALPSSIPKRYNNESDKIK